MTINNSAKTFILLFFPIIVHAQIGQSLITGGQISSMGRASVAMQGSPEALWHNPANVRGIKGKTAILSSEWRYGAKDFRPIAIGYILPTASSVMGFQAHYFGFSGVSVSRLGVTYARPFSEKMDIGIHLKYQYLRLRDIDGQSNIGFDIGFNMLIINNLRMGFYAENPIPFRKNTNDIPPSVFHLGLSYLVNQNVLVCTEVVKDIAYPAALRFGIEYKPSPTLYLRCGFETKPTTFAFGIGYAFSDKIKMDISLSQHAVLGATPALSLVFNEKSK
jgi:hypothetical protein